ncbi:50S ribosome-binding GTPase [Providencia rettgeri]|uniref:GTPase family protein n=2 Tax=Providencia TaxID=586 RepID=UPI001B390D34|nr:GTPase [Providencia rettgeri]EJD6370314.1 50S ribosome-binding GTPase [Providencia rettgeri]EJD6374756.1 50S ribosome-binding GTPase [Providencia rettgeri]ELR5033166.1 50S ribosome-binding GTPase [Providencia rettgeri]ELR5159930.1 50S ribosome-binding GTPase [Providencia rettgeri]ELR5208998.1 50S ribosome-binding GTPase [Providencia rettgeri]
MHQNSHFKSTLSVLPHSFQTSFFNQLNHLINYSPTIGLMGKTGAGKSSLINAIFQSQLSPVSNVSGCTRQAQRFSMSMNNHTLTFVDLPGVGESLERDKEYHQLYRNLLPELDLIIWVLKADDRAWSSDEQCYRFLTEQCGYQSERFLFVLNQADKIEPCRQWDEHKHHPSPEQAANLVSKQQAVIAAFKPHHPVMTVSAVENYQLTELAEQLIQALPAQASSGVARQLNNTYRTQSVEDSARNDFGQCVSDIVNTLIDILPLPVLIKSTIGTVKNSIVSIAKSLWSLFF